MHKNETNTRVDEKSGPRPSRVEDCEQSPGSTPRNTPQTKTCHFPHPFSVDLTSKIHTRFQTWLLKFILVKKAILVNSPKKSARMIYFEHFSFSTIQWS